MIRKSLFIASLVFLFSAPAVAEERQDRVEVLANHHARHFHRFLPAGQYSGITHVGDDVFAVVSDDEKGYTFFLWRIGMDDDGRIRRVENLGSWSDGSDRDNDLEGIAYNPHRNTLLLSSERHHSIVELDMEGKRTGRSVALPEEIAQSMRSNCSLEALCYDVSNHIVWTANESTLTIDGKASTSTNGLPSISRLFAYDDQLQPIRFVRYRTEAPTSCRRAKHFVLGVSAMAALGDGRLLVMEREARVTARFIGSKVVVRIFVVDPDKVDDGEFVEKRLLATIRTRFGLTRQNWANYEGMALMPANPDGSRTLVLIADSQKHYRGVLKDWLKTFKLALQ